MASAYLLSGRRGNALVALLRLYRTRAGENIMVDSVSQAGTFLSATRRGYPTDVGSYQGADTTVNPQERVIEIVP